MALSMLSSIPNLITHTRLPIIIKSSSCKASPRGIKVKIGNSNCEEIIVRRTANYHPTIWDYDYVQSLRSDYVGETYTRRLDKLKRDVKPMLGKVKKPLDQLELIDVLQRLGIYYHFKDEIKRILNSIYNQYNRHEEWQKDDLYSTALEFRLLRQHGYDVPQDVFSRFKDETGSFKACLCEDIKGLLCLYEASYLCVRGESTLEQARDFAHRHLGKGLEQNIDQNLAIEVKHALELPLHWRMPRLEARWFIDVYEKRQDMNPILLEFAKLDFNMVQATHQEDLRHMSSWWSSTRLGEKLNFARDRLMENFLWTVGVISEPQYGYCRRMSTKVNTLITIIDDVYDVYGTMDELELFTDVVDRWDINAMDPLPEYMKLCFLALYNSTNEMAYDALKEHGLHIVSYLRKAWSDLCKSYLLEAKWYYSGYTPSLQEYISNSWISIAGPVILVHAYFLVANPITKEALQSLERYHNIIRWSSMILRLSDDLGTSLDELKRGDVPKSIQCYMYETGASEEDARKHTSYLIGETWKKLNEDGAVKSPFPETFIGIAMNLARMAQCMYQHGDGHGIEYGETEDRVLSLLVEPIPSLSSE
ncbi:(-)-alpha-terpineol synthase [Vitis riparia]|uniref:(-)-alpha-terpineol synthase n=1 Tax=Vitis riparia TaxID=96939 RepID=UPI00155AE526|nr:(-)-alpha-terpineol synthase [Vitis riparia]